MPLWVAFTSHLVCISLACAVVVALLAEKLLSENTDEKKTRKQKKRRSDMNQTNSTCLLFGFVHLGHLSSLLAYFGDK
eukprot:732743-Amphidinium_carterae.1